MLELKEQPAWVREKGGPSQATENIRVCDCVSAGSGDSSEVSQSLVPALPHRVC